MLSVQLATAAADRSEGCYMTDPSDRVRFVFINLADGAKLEATDTGCTLPDGVRVVPQKQCSRCDAPPRDLCVIRIAGERVYEACAECLADFVASRMVTVEVRHVDGHWACCESCESDL